jgi:hypothetical protein
MQEQIFSLSIEYYGDLSTQAIKDWLKQVLTGKVSRCIGMVAESFGSTPGGRMIQGSLRIVHNENVSVDMMKSFLATTPSTFKIITIAKR